MTNVDRPPTDDGAHVRRPFAPKSKIEVSLNRPGWQWRWHGYFNANFGARALKAHFSYRTWRRFHFKDGAACFYDATRRDGSELAVGIGFAEDGTARAIDMPLK
jgi:carotenoid 1,2-hydratase